MRATTMQQQPEQRMSLPTPEVILNSIIDGVLVVNHEGVIIYANPAAERLFGKERDQLCGAGFGYPVNADEVNEILVISTGTVKHFQMVASAISWHDHEAFLLSLRDVTELKAISKELEEKKAKVESANMELQQYASLASHDLKEPIRKIRIFADQLLHKKELNADVVKSHLQKISRSADRMQMLISGIAEFSHVMQERDSYIETDLNVIVKDILDDLDLQISEKKAIVQVDKLPTVSVIPVQMHQLFLNLVSNALKYSKKEVPPVIHITSEDDDECAIITISDNGIGLNDQYAEKIFQPFQRLSKDVDGSGIGLAICKRIVEVHGGHIRVNSVLGEGAQFRFTILKNNTWRG